MTGTRNARGPLAAAAVAACVCLAMPAAGLAEEAEDTGRIAAPEGARVYIVTPSDGATVSGPVTVVFGLAGMGVAPAGVNIPGTGHHHLLVNGALQSLDDPIPGSPGSIHFGMGQTETTLELEPGEHTLQLVLGDWRHIPHDPPVMSEPITIVVE